MKQALSHLIHCCEDGATLECPIIEALDGAAGTPRDATSIRSAA